MTRLPGMSLNGTGPEWFVIWLVIWSIDRTVLQGGIAGIALGWLQDGLTAHWPSHALGLALVGGVCAQLYSRRFWKTDLIATPVIVVAMVGLTQAILLLQFSLFLRQSPLVIWDQQASVFWISPLLSAIWTPALFWPLRQWWNYLKKLQD
ncbi:rod shape-determining protein MreD [Lyngbya confervoides BDU141951]|uniref:Rod shape-determining protein MreD n=2 Tax=Lyngbya TaxID=28073 RepID=A0ABD4T380_9CYAN|nr:rod shape-determining protein MreD [Lyngbya confervoides BDU141951]